MKSTSFKTLFRPVLIICIYQLLQVSFFFQHVSGQDDYRPPLFFREDWKEIDAAIPVTQEHVNSPDLILSLYGPGRDSIKKSHHDQPSDDPYYVWSGLCRGNWLVTLKHKEYLADLSGFAKIKWRTKQAGMRKLHLVLKLNNGTWLISRQSDGPTTDWRIREYNLKDLDWFTLDAEHIVEVSPVQDPDLSRIDEIGFTDLMSGGSSQACSRLDWIEVYGFKIKR